MKAFATGRVTVTIVEPDGARRLVFKDEPNTGGADLIGRLCYYCAHTATSSPVTVIGLKYNTTTVYTAGITNTGPTAYSTTGYSWLSTGTWTNNTGAQRTITDLYLLNNVSDPTLTYATLGSQSIGVDVGASLEVQWTVILRRNASGGTGFPVAFFSRLCSLFIAAGTTHPVTFARYTADNAAYVDASAGDPTSGGTVTSTNVVWQISATAPAGAATLAAITLYDNDVDVNGKPYPVDEQTGFSNTWVAGTVITDTYTMTWADDGV